jgi:hypothetical protein
MYTVKCDGDVFELETMDDVLEMWSEIVMAMGAEDAEMTLSFTPSE